MNRRPVSLSRWAGTLTLAVASCGGEAPEAVPIETAIPAFASASEDYCAVPEFGLDVLAERPGAGAPAIDDVNWFARPVPHEGDDWIIAFASHDQNYIYNLTTDRRVRIPDRSDAVATPDGRYMTVPSSYTPDANIRFYPVAPMLTALAEGRDVADLPPVFIHDHPAMHRVYYQSTGLVSRVEVGDTSVSTYRLMFSGGHDESQFRIVDYAFSHDRRSDALLRVVPTEPMAVCPEVRNDLNTPFISKDGFYVAAYTSEAAGSTWAPGASLKVFEITSVDPAAGTTTCRPVADVGFAAGKADFSYDGSELTFHLSQGAYLTPFVNGGLPSGTITDVVVARFGRDPDGDISGFSGMQRLSTSLSSGTGSYFPAYFPDGSLFFVSNAVARDSKEPKRFTFRVVDPASRGWRTTLLTDPEHNRQWAELGSLWQAACMPANAGTTEPFPLGPHELPAQAMALAPRQCEALVRDARATAGPQDPRDWDGLAGLCRAIEP